MDMKYWIIIITLVAIIVFYGKAILDWITSSRDGYVAIGIILFFVIGNLILWKIES